MRITCVGGGPAGLYLGILMKLRDDSHQVRIIERNRADDTFGFGVVFSDATMDNLKAADPVTHKRITDSFWHWDEIDTFIEHRGMRGLYGHLGRGRSPPREGRHRAETARSRPSMAGS